MLVRTLTYTDYNGTERTEDFMFNLTEAETTEMELTAEGGLSTYIRKIVDSKDIPEIVALFKDLLLKSYGVKSDDGRRFIKSKELSEAFSQTEAFSMLYMELSMNDEKASEFIKGILPAKLSKRIKHAEISGGETAAAPVLGPAI